MKFRVLRKDSSFPSTGTETVYLRIDFWNDFSFVTQFYVALHDADGQFHRIGETKIGFKGQTIKTGTYEKLPDVFDHVDETFFSLGQSVEFYRSLASFPNKFGENILLALRDIVVLPALITEIENEPVFGTSLLRSTSLSIVRGQFARVLAGKAELTDYKFKFIREASDRYGRLDLDFNVVVASRPNTNIHAIIGRNGVGKTTLLNGMIHATTGAQEPTGKFFDATNRTEKEIARDFFSSLVSVSFSAFDPFTPPNEQPDPSKGTCYFYIGLKDQSNEEVHRTIGDLRNDCVRALLNCFYKDDKTVRWRSAIETLGSDDNFSSMRLEQLQEMYLRLRQTTNVEEQSDSETFVAKYRSAVTPFLSRMSAGHSVVLLTITRLVATVEEKTLVLLDEPESHLHPPLLSAFLRALADLLHDRNGVAIVATHSPVVLQEIPRSCVWKIFRRGGDIVSSRPDVETFAENVGVLTSEVFGLEVERSGFHHLLAESVKTGVSYETILENYDYQLGLEGRAILSALVAIRDGDKNP